MSEKYAVGDVLQLYVTRRVNYGGGYASAAHESVAGEGVDVLQWEGLHDHTRLLHWP
jgi:hypothetical protein